MQRSAMATTARDEIGARLARRRDTAVLAERLLGCRSGSCGGCGDICPVRAARFYRDNQINIWRLFRGDQVQSIQRLHFSVASWSREEGQLSEAQLGATFQTLRRALNRLHEPSIRAVGTVDASWGGARWHLAANIVVSAPLGADMFRALNRAEHVIALDVHPVPSVGAEILRIFREAHYAECIAESAVDRTIVPLNRLRREYYSWLSGIKPGGRIFRYGCDRYFAPLKKQLHWKPVVRKPRPWPRWLVPYQYGSHPYGCDCRICQGGRH
jgi:hypothetical protein